MLLPENDLQENKPALELVLEIWFLQFKICRTRAVTPLCHLKLGNSVQKQKRGHPSFSTSLEDPFLFINSVRELFVLLVKTELLLC